MLNLFSHLQEGGKGLDFNLHEGKKIIPQEVEGAFSFIGSLCLGEGCVWALVKVFIVSRVHPSFQQIVSSSEKKKKTK